MQEIILRCDCHGNHFVSVTTWPEDHDKEDIAFLEIGGYFQAGGPLARARLAWGALRGRQVHQAEVNLGRDDVERLRDYLGWAAPRLWRHPYGDSPEGWAPRGAGPQEA
jgi:hypothetical protein